MTEAIYQGESPDVRVFGEPVFTVPEAAKAAKASEWNIWALLKTGRIKRTKFGGKTFIRLSELQKLVSDKSNAPSKPKRAR